MKLAALVRFSLVLSSFLVCHIASAFVVHGSIRTAAKQTKTGWKKRDPAINLTMSVRDKLECST